MFITYMFMLGVSATYISIDVMRFKTIVCMLFGMCVVLVIQVVIILVADLLARKRLEPLNCRSKLFTDEARLLIL